MLTTNRVAFRFLAPLPWAPFLWVMVLLAVSISSGCGSADSPAPPQASIDGGGQAAGAATEPGETPGAAAPKQLSAEDGSPRSPAQRPVERDREVLIKTSLGDIRVRLNAEKAPQTVGNFLENYVDRGFYDETIFHYVDTGFMVAAGGYTEQFEPITTRTAVTNESDNGLSNRQGTIAMARDPQYVHSATSQFYFNLVDNTSLDHKETEDGVPNGYCVFGEVVEGMDVVEKIAQVNVNDRENFPKSPVEPVKIESIRRVAR